MQPKTVLSLLMVTFAYFVAVARTTSPYDDQQGNSTYNGDGLKNLLKSCAPIIRSHYPLKDRNILISPTANAIAWDVILYGQSVPKQTTIMEFLGVKSPTANTILMYQKKIANIFAFMTSPASTGDQPFFKHFNLFLCNRNQPANTTGEDRVTIKTDFQRSLKNFLNTAPGILNFRQRMKTIEMRMIEQMTNGKSGYPIENIMPPKVNANAALFGGLYANIPWSNPMKLMTYATKFGDRDSHKSTGTVYYLYGVQPKVLYLNGNDTDYKSDLILVPFQQNASFALFIIMPIKQKLNNHGVTTSETTKMLASLLSGSVAPKTAHVRIPRVRLSSRLDLGAAFGGDIELDQATNTVLNISSVVQQNGLLLNEFGLRTLSDAWQIDSVAQPSPNQMNYDIEVNVTRPFYFHILYNVNAKSSTTNNIPVLSGRVIQP